MAQVDHQKDNRPAWLIAAAKTKEPSSTSRSASGPSSFKGSLEASRKGSLHNAATRGKTFQPEPSASKSNPAHNPKDRLKPRLDTVAKANLNPEFLNVLEDVMGVESDEDYEEPEVDYPDTNTPTPTPDYEDHPSKSNPLLRPRNKTLTATKSLDAEARLRPSSFGESSSGDRPKASHHRLSGGSDDNHPPNIHTAQRNLSVPNISSGGLTTLPRDFAPNLRITASHQARLLREAGRWDGGTKPTRSGNPLKKQTLSSGNGLLRRPREGALEPPPDYDGAPETAMPARQNKVLNNLQTAMNSGWFYGYGIVVKNLKERLEYISKHQTDKPRKSIEITRHKDRQRKDSATYEAGMTRELAVEILRRQRVGSYILRDSISSPGNMAISIKTVRGRDPWVIDHFLLLRTSKGGVVLKDFDREWPNMKAFTNSLAQAAQGGKERELRNHLGIQ